MKFCIECGNQLVDGAKFCANCGKEVSSDQTEIKSQRKTTYEGEIHKCPNCGEVLNSFVTNCPNCGYELRGTNATSSVNELAKKIESVETIEQKIEIIRNFYIPNTKEDIYEFFILAVSNINAGGDDIDAWLTKLDQVYQKAKLTFGNNPEFEELKKLYNKTNRKRTGKLIGKAIKKSKLLQSGIVCSIGLLLTVIGFVGGNASDNSDSPIYMLSMVGVLAIFYGFLYFLFAITGSDKNDNNDDE